MKKISYKIFTRKMRTKEERTECQLGLVQATGHIMGGGGYQEAGQSLIRRRISDGELYAHHKRTSISSRSLNLEGPQTVYEMTLREGCLCPTQVGSYRRMDSKENDEHASSTGDLHKASEENKKEFLYTNPRSGSLDRRRISIYVEGILRGQSLDTENTRRKYQGDTSDEDLDKTPTDVTPTGSSTSDVTPTGSREDILLRRCIRKRFSKRWWPGSRHTIAEGESVRQQSSVVGEWWAVVAQRPNPVPQRFQNKCRAPPAERSLNGTITFHS